MKIDTYHKAGELIKQISKAQTFVGSASNTDAGISIATLNLLESGFTKEQKESVRLFILEIAKRNLEALNKEFENLKDDEL